MKKNNPQNFLDSFFNSIELFSDELGEESIYKGVNLKYALERSIYFNFIEDERIYESFIKKRTFLTFNYYKNQIIEYIIGTRSPFYLRLLTKILILAKRLPVILIGLLANLYFIKTPKKSSKIIYYIDNQKFIHYLKPIFRNQKTPFCIAVRDKKIIAYLKKENLEFDHIELKFSKNIFRSHVVDDFFLTDLFETFHTYFLEKKPKVVVLVEGNSPDDEIINRVCKKLKIKTICIQQGWSPFLHNGFRNMSFDRMLVWGRGFADLFKPYNKLQKFTPVGNHQLEISDSELSNGTSIVFFLQEKSRIISVNNNINMYKLIKWVASNFPDISVIVRKPSFFTLDDKYDQDIKGFKNVKFMPYWEYSLIEVLKMSSISVSIYSTTILESIAMGVVPIIFNETMLDHYNPNISEISAGIETNTLVQAKYHIRKLVENKQNLKIYKMNLKNVRDYFFRNGDITKRIINIIEETSGIHS